MKEKNNVFIIGDSYSTYEGYIPEEYRFYYSDGRADATIVCGVEKMWWRLLAKKAEYDIYDSLI